MAEPDDTKLPESIDPENGHDRRLLRRAARENWGLTSSQKQDARNAMHQIVLHGDKDRERVSAARVMVAMDAIDQADEHLQRKEERADDGKASEVIRYEVNIPGPKRIDDQ